jgi:hypothetical protein
MLALGSPKYYYTRLPFFREFGTWRRAGTPALQVPAFSALTLIYYWGMLLSLRLRPCREEPLLLL